MEISSFYQLKPEGPQNLKIVAVDVYRSYQPRCLIFWVKDIMLSNKIRDQNFWTLDLDYPMWALLNLRMML